MSSSAVAVRGLGKRYRVYQSPSDRLKDALGLGWVRRISYQEFWALRGFDLEVQSGERVGIIGRNGAGKSTLLKVISGRVAPTEGAVDVRGSVQALLELGTGFHPEFSGLDNIRASLNYQGLSRREIASREEEIIDFTELGEFIERPLKTYSTGMYTRLAFAVATSVEPEVLIIDEVLGGGDAYFAGKSIDRMKRLALEKGATVLFVSHDTSMVEMLCERCVWIERGELKMDGPASAVSRSYAGMIRELTSARLRSQNQMAGRARGARGRSTAQVGHVQEIIRFVGESKRSLSIHNVELISSGERRLVVDVGSPQDNAVDFDAFILTDASSRWGRPESIGARTARRLSPEGGLPSAVVFNLDAAWASGPATVRVTSAAQRGAAARIEAFAGDRYEVIGTIEARKGGERVDEFALTPDVLSALAAASGIASLNGAGQATASFLAEGDVVGEGGRVAIANVLVEVNGSSAGVASTFDELRVHVDYEVAGPPVEAVFVICIHRLGIIAMQAVSTLEGHEPGLPDVIEGKGRATLVVPSIPLGAGSYLLSVGIFPPIDYRSKDTERTAYVLHDRRYRLEVTQPELIEIDLGMCRGSVRWNLAQPVPRP